jgi:hypothetical protein
MNGPPHLLGEVSNTSKTAQLKELRRFLFKRKFIWVNNTIWDSSFVRANITLPPIIDEVKLQELKPEIPTEVFDVFSDYGA